MTTLDKHQPLLLSGDRFRVVYHLTGSPAHARSVAEEICVEQTIEFPADLITRSDIRDQIFGQVEALQPLDEHRCEVTISYAVETASGELPQLLNVLFGNISLKPGIRLWRLELGDELLSSFRGPRFGRAGWRRLLGIAHRPLLCTALKPMGLSPSELAELAYQFALGGIDLIKDDHGLANQSFCPFTERVKRCGEAIARASKQTGRPCSYLPNITAPAHMLFERAQLAKEYGAGGFLVSPGLTGLDSMRQLADDDALALPIMSHPALQGSFIVSRDAGVSHQVAFGQLARLAGADATIFPNYGGRFAFSDHDCRQLVAGAEGPMGSLHPIFPVPAGGMSVERVPEMLDYYGREVILLIGGDLHRGGSDLVASCRRFRQSVENAAQ